MTDKQLLIRNGLVFDGTGAPGQTEDVLIQGDRIVEVGPVGPVEGARVLDARGKAVAPGFVDIHTHSDMASLEVPLAESRVLSGVTTELVGHCGMSAFPLRGQSRSVHLSALGQANIELDWEDIEGYLGKAESIGYSANRAVLIGHNTIRAAVLGYAKRKPTADELRQMVDEVRHALECGAFGLSSGLIYPPGCYCETDELTELCRVVAQADGLYATHIRNEGDTLIEAVQEQLDITRNTGVRLQIAHLKVWGKRNWDKIDQLHELLKGAIEEGLDVTADRYPYTAGQTGLYIVLPSWSYEGGTTEAAERLNSPETRARLREEVLTNYRSKEDWEAITICYAQNAENKRFEGMSALEAAEVMGLEPVDAVFDLLISEKLKTRSVFHFMSEENLRTILTWPFVMIGSDSQVRTVEAKHRQGKPHPRAYGTAARVLGRYVRETGPLKIEEAIYKLSGQPAERIGLKDRGLLKKGYFADVAVFDPETVIDNATFEDPHRYSTGIETVIVNGVLTVEAGKHTGVKAGRTLKR